MRKSFVALLLAVGVTAFAANLALASFSKEEAPDFNPKLATKALTTRAAKLGTSAVAPDTVYVGYTPGHSADNYWSVWAGNNRVGSGSLSGLWHRPPAQGGMWDFEPPYTSVHGDSLQGWWPIRFQMTGASSVYHDYNFTWRALDFGNMANYAWGTGSYSLNRRTFGVVGVWHVDGGNSVTGLPSSLDWSADVSGGSATAGTAGVNWAPLAGTKSAWMGLRRHGDNTYTDPITGNPFNEDLLAWEWTNPVSSGGTDKKFPGYGSSMDQMLYRDIDLSALGTDKTLQVSFQYQTAMSTQFGVTNSSRTGWFDHDPLAVITGGTNPNFISNEWGGTWGPADSFMVYVGSPVEGSAMYSDGVSRPLYDPLRRWFDEVIAWDPTAASNSNFYSEIASFAGNGTGAVNVTIPSATVANIMSHAGSAYATNKVRVVFRVHTNRNYDDELYKSLGYTSAGRGAAQVDNVVVKDVSNNTLLNSQFESASEINNSAGTLATAAWKSTGKPTAPYWHIHQLSPYPGGSLNLNYQDLCGQVGDPHRICDMQGQIMSHGNHDDGESSGGAPGSSEQERYAGMVSPTVNLAVSNGVTNNMGLQGGNSSMDPIATTDVYLDYEGYFGVFDIFSTGNSWQTGAQAYPSANSATGATEHKRWGEIRFPGFINFNPDKQCYRVWDGLQSGGLIKTTNLSGIPDSLRIVIRTLQQTYRFGVSITDWRDGAYWDNLSLDFVDGGPGAPIAADIWQFINDTFPASDTQGLAGTAAFDTTAALVKSGFNIAPSPGTEARFNVPGDTTVVVAEGDSVRMDLVFRILPGPGNYVNPALGINSQLKAVPTSATPIPTPVLGVTNFWSNYMFNNGAKGTPGGHPTATSGPLAGQKIWSPNVWNSARMDTAEVNVFNMQGRGVYQPADGQHWMTAYHETELADPHRGALGIPRNICFVADSTKTTSLDAVICGSGPVPAGTTYPPNWATAAAGFNGVTTTKEGTKIIPDGLLTPGSHVEYFFRRQDGTSSTIYFMPETTVVTPQNGEGSTDAHRWQEFGVLPDRWKSGSYTHPVLGTPGRGAACMLYVDWNDRRGDEKVWVSVADSIGATRAEKYGAHNGWHASGADGTDINDPTWWVFPHIGMPGTTWDMYGVKASESLTTGSGSLGGRGGPLGLSLNDATNPQINTKTSRQGPSEEMLNTYYKILNVWTGDLNSGMFGPFTNKSNNDFKIMEDFLLSGDTNTPNRAFLGEGNGFVEGTDYTFGAGTNPEGDHFLNSFFGVYLAAPGYRSVSLDLFDTSNLHVQPVITGSGKEDILGIHNACTYTLDVMGIAPGPPTTVGSYYGDTHNYVSGVVKTWAGTSPWITVVDGWDPWFLHGRNEVTDFGRLAYYYNVFANVFGQVCQVDGSPTITTDTPQADDGRVFMSLRNNPLRSGSATVAFGLAKTDRVKIQIFDVSGRLVRTLADRTFAPGEHKLTWDGTDNQGRQVSRGVFFVRSQHAASKFTAQSKLIVLK